jgi:pyroglutamyl-peptidase
MATALITGFEGYGGRGRNPSGETALALNGRTIAGVRVEGRRLPVSFSALAAGLEGLLDEVEPDIVISVGLWPGEPMMRLERIGINVADFEIPDNEGTLRSDVSVRDAGSAALLATLPNREIRDALLSAGIPARISATAGTFLCNAALYTTLSLAARKHRAPLTGFVHVPYLPEQVAELLQSIEAARQLELHQRADWASMDLAMMVRALEIAVATAAKHLSCPEDESHRP